MKKTPQRTFTKAELRIMEQLWQRGSATVAEIVAAIGPPALAYTTVLTVLRVLERKGAVTHEPAGRAHVYRAVVERDDAARTAIGEVLKSFFANSKTALALRLLSEAKPSPGEIERIKSVLSDYERKRR
jgi:predicted transcriptional regulator